MADADILGSAQQGPQGEYHIQHGRSTWPGPVSGGYIMIAFHAGAIGASDTVAMEFTAPFDIWIQHSSAYAHGVTGTPTSSLWGATSTGQTQILSEVAINSDTTVPHKYVFGASTATNRGVVTRGKALRCLVTTVGGEAVDDFTMYVLAYVKGHVYTDPALDYPQVDKPGAQSTALGGDIPAYMQGRRSYFPMPINGRYDVIPFPVDSVTAGNAKTVVRMIPASCYVMAVSAHANGITSDPTYQVDNDTTGDVIVAARNLPTDFEQVDATDGTLLLAGRKINKNNDVSVRYTCDAGDAVDFGQVFLTVYTIGHVSNDPVND